MGGLDHTKENILFVDKERGDLSSMITLGLTGGIASGKSTVAKMLARRGARIIDADRIARQVVEPGEKAWKQIVAYFGNDFLLPDGAIDRGKLAACVFADKKKREKLEAITHPAILARVRENLEAARAAGCRVAVLDVPLLIETGWTNMVDRLWLVYADREVQKARLIRRNNLTAEEAELRLAAQMPLAEKRKYADVIIDNSGPPALTETQITKAWEDLLRAHNSFDCP